jgi:hypothetical protein
MYKTPRSALQLFLSSTRNLSELNQDFNPHHSHLAFKLTPSTNLSPGIRTLSPRVRIYEPTCSVY